MNSISVSQISKKLRWHDAGQLSNWLGTKRKCFTFNIQGTDHKPTPWSTDTRGVSLMCSAGPCHGVTPTEANSVWALIDIVSYCALNLFLETKTISSFRLLDSDCHHDDIQFFSTNCIICLCSDFPLFCLLEGRGTVIFVYVIQAVTALPMGSLWKRWGEWSNLNSSRLSPGKESSYELEWSSLE